MRSAWGAPSHNPASRFLDEIPPTLVDWRRTAGAQTSWGRTDHASRSGLDFGAPTAAGRRNFGSQAARLDAAKKAKPARAIQSPDPGDRDTPDTFWLGPVVSDEEAGAKSVASDRKSVVTGREVGVSVKLR